MVESISSDISICDTPTRKRRRSERTVGHAPEIASPSKKSNSGTSKAPLKVILRVNKKKGDDVSNTVECEEPLKLSGLSPLNSSPCQACALNNRPCRPHSKLAKACSECKKRKNKCSLASEVASAGESIVVTRSPLPKKSKGARKGTA
ncbi:hypothetical protein BD410DRAFT_315656 [Rickenella mellea]|uniref:Uncharacterized protein n=1 Tax=Rickenella mellea TaxID=50990 RepID=A0A4Y7Q2L1_9AGAM|nr:hypothetical protein BD410DRAFT_315656 [Rickenella mellea]